ncbi:MAG TPA: dihydroxyacetone kinase phosphoryl donor subunit DhaM [Thermomicrobiales bacterium]|nr:dihydroxyacetone kinase phosphoryl donor subunit DhaM [Thermomicrobiales bacterium]
MMVGLLIVSHSPKIAEGVHDLAGQVTAGSVPLAWAGGLPDGSLGTSADLIRAAAETIAPRCAGGIIVLADLGSAIMSAELALEDFPTPYRIANAPLVEGALLAAVEASVGADLARVIAAAEGARDLPKVQA